MSLNYFRFKQNGRNVIVIVDGKTVAELPWAFAHEVIAAFINVTKLAEEFDNAEQIAKDNAILIRAGMPFGLSNNPKILEESKKIAEWDKDMRQMGAIKSEEVVGTPTILQKKPKKGK